MASRVERTKVATDFSFSSNTTVSSQDQKTQELSQTTIKNVGNQRAAFVDQALPVTKKTRADDLELPVVDMQDYVNPETKPFFLDTLYQAMITVGFFAVRNTGVEERIVSEAYAQSEKFFKGSEEVKAACKFPESFGQRGFTPGETAKGSTRKDFKEFYHIGREGLEPPNIWPESQPEFKNALLPLYQELERFVVPLQRVIIDAINSQGETEIPLDLLNESTEGGPSLLRALYYPVQTNSLELLSWADEHTDIDNLAILPFATEKGLQVKFNGQWRTVVVPRDTFIVNIGDMLKNKTNGLLESAWHRVVNLEPGKERFSMVFFVHPRPDTSLAPLEPCIALTGGTQEYGPGTRDEFLMERLIDLRLAPNLLEPYSKTGHVESQARFGRASPQIVQMLRDANLASPELEAILKESLLWTKLEALGKMVRI